MPRLKHRARVGRWKGAICQPRKQRKGSSASGPATGIGAFPRLPEVDKEAAPWINKPQCKHSQSQSDSQRKRLMRRWQSVYCDFIGSLWGYQESNEGNVRDFHSSEEEEAAVDALAQFHLERLLLYSSDPTVWEAIEHIAFETVLLPWEVTAIRKAMRLFERDLFSRGKSHAQPWWISFAFNPVEALPKAFSGGTGAGDDSKRSLGRVEACWRAFNAWKVLPGLVPPFQPPRHPYKEGMRSIFGYKGRSALRQSFGTPRGCHQSSYATFFTYQETPLQRHRSRSMGASTKTTAKVVRARLADFERK
ncbi:hypothetical protein BKA70DRAFT_1518699 [Coprinopsis sp. MPI-PUGE-AT-0042]|nr:hypothetical protein BKA70DRAFT_1518699 [Coprinopsis sp. MPI-PUGE-AT-0042]